LFREYVATAPEQLLLNKLQDLSDELGPIHFAMATPNGNVGIRVGYLESYFHGRSLDEAVESVRAAKKLVNAEQKKKDLERAKRWAEKAEREAEEGLEDEAEEDE
jgi:hypothetical protein